ncbi:hypothetical protein R5R35_009458 [Gryllus longicercus]|uniref:Inositol-1-monophosphatase n=1 Tax=Gryllus longicercus TaxID=2509291 RepID=A0AAN9Z8V7_9ORTH
MDIFNQEILEVAVEIVKKAGELMLKGFYAVKKVDTKTASYDVVTEYDKKTENLIISELKKAFPSHRFIGEESTEGPNEVEITNEPTWIIDPIDGTCNYIHGVSESAISVGFAVNKEVTVGVVYNPILNLLFTACKGMGAFQNGKKIHVSTCSEHSKSLVATEISFAGMTQYEHQVIERLRGLVKGAHGARAIGCAATTLCYVANGSIDAYVQDGLYCWDVAAGSIIVKEAGGIVLNSNGKPFQLTEKKILVASTQPLADQLIAIIKEADEKASHLL